MPDKRTSNTASWPADWQCRGWNGCMESAADALRFLASNERPIGGCDTFNAEHLIQIVAELKKTQRELLAESKARLEAMERELIAWRLRYPGQGYQEGVGIVAALPGPCQPPAA